MSEKVASLVLDQLRPIREDIRHVQHRFSARVDGLDARMDDLPVRMQSVEGILMGLGGYIRSIDRRAEDTEIKLGSEA